MSHEYRWAALLILPLAFAPLACGDEGEDRSALEEDELSRELDLALQGDTAPATFEDTARVEVEQPSDSPAAQPAPQAQSPRPTQPRQTQPRQTQPRQEPERQGPRTVSRSVPAGTSMSVRLEQTISTETNSVGDSFSATLSEPLVAADGTTIIPAGATVRGRVTGVKTSGRVGETALIKVAFESISFGGESYPLRATVVEANPERRTRTTRGEQAAKIGAGAAAGAILGQVLGKDREATIAGAAIGAAAGTAIAMGTSDVDAVLAQGSRMVIRLDAPISVETRL